MTKSAEVKGELLEALASVLDEPLRQRGFTRKRNSLTYQRVLSAAEHQITLAIDCFPRYQPGAEAHVQPMLQLKMPAVSERALTLVNGDRMLLANAPDVLVNQPIEFTAPKDKHQRWFATGKAQFVVVCTSIQAFLDAWVLPFLSEVTTPADLIKLYESGDPRIMKQKHWYIFIVAAYQTMGQFEHAREVVRQQFGGAGLRKRYAPLFASLAMN